MLVADSLIVNSSTFAFWETTSALGKHSIDRKITIMILMTYFSYKFGALVLNAVTEVKRSCYILGCCSNFFS
jgi:hypothetical protein